MKPPIAEIDLPAFHADPYPWLERLRRESPIAYVPQLNGVVISKRKDIAASEKNVAVFSSEQPEGLMNQLMGHNMMRKDGAAHTHERKMLLPAFVPEAINSVWKPLFQQDVDARLDRFEEGQVVDLVSDFAMPVSADALARVTGLKGCRPGQLDAWSQAMIDGISNYQGDDQVRHRCVTATDEIDRAIEAQAAALGETDGVSDAADAHSMLGVMRAAGLAPGSVAANIKLAISGGQNEPRDAIAGTVWALLYHQEQLQLIQQGQASWLQAFEEYCRWISPIGMSPRRVARAHAINGIELEPEDKVFFMFGSANRDEDWFERADQYDLTRNTSKAIAFGAGPHFCIAAGVSRCLAADVALPSLFRRFPRMKLVDPNSIRLAGWAFRGLLELPVELRG